MRRKAWYARWMFLFSQEKIRCQLLSKQIGVMRQEPGSSAFQSADMCSGVLAKVVVMCWSKCRHNLMVPSKFYHVTRM